MKNWPLFLRSLRRHPGLTLGFVWPLLCLLSFLLRKDVEALPIGRVLIALALLSVLPWIPIVWTSWAGRHQHLDEQ